MRRITLYIYQNSYVSQSGGGAPKAWITPDHPGSPRITPSDPHGSPPLEHPGSSTDHAFHRVGEVPQKPGSPRISLDHPGSPPRTPMDHPPWSTPDPPRITSQPLGNLPPGRCFSGTWVLFYTLQESITPLLGYLCTFLPAPTITYVKFFYRLRVLYM